MLTEIIFELYAPCGTVEGLLCRVMLSCYHIYFRDNYSNIFKYLPNIECSPTIIRCKVAVLFHLMPLNSCFVGPTTSSCNCRIRRQKLQVQTFFGKHGKWLTLFLPKKKKLRARSHTKAEPGNTLKTLLCQERC